MRKNLAFLALSAVTIICTSFALSHAGRGQPTDSEKKIRLFEIRTYTTEPGKLDALNTRFREHTTKLFEKHGMTNIGYWTPVDEPRSEDTLIYVLAHESADAAKKSWDGFRSDPQWQKARSESEAAGPIVKKVESVFMTPTDYSAIK
jgi:hypothetical protein